MADQRYKTEVRVDPDRAKTSIDCVRATCQCTWTSRWCRTWEEANEIAEEHVSQRAHRTSRQRLEGVA